MNCIAYDKIINCLLFSLSDLVRYDMELITRKVKEECINHRLANYLEDYTLNLLNNNKHNFNNKLSVDVEYNKNMDDRKSINVSGNVINIRPDIIVHERRTNKNNIMAIECKMRNQDAHAKQKLMQLASHPYNYKCCICLVYRPHHEDMKLHILNLVTREFTTQNLIKTQLLDPQQLSIIKTNIYNSQNYSLSKPT